MVKVELTELDINAISAALDQRMLRLEQDLAKLERMEPSSSREFSIECVLDAMLHGSRARLTIIRARDEPETDMTYVRVFGDEPELVLRAMHGDR